MDLAAAAVVVAAYSSFHSFRYAVEVASYLDSLDKVMAVMEIKKIFFYAYHK